MRVLAPAKINVLLSVGERRADGLHELVSVMQTISLADEVEVVPADRWSVSVDPPGSAPDNKDNLVLRAGKTFGTLHGDKKRAHFSLRKQIPMAAGLGGGSSDAAAALVGLNALWEAGVSRKALEQIAATVGADVPFCVRGGTAVVRGAGEDLAELASAVTWWVVGISERQLPTAAVYEEFDKVGSTELGDPHAVADALARRDFDALAEAMHNDLEEAALSIAPEIEEGRGVLEEAGAVRAMLTGSGPTWIGLAWNEQHAKQIAEACGDFFHRIEVARSLDRGARIMRGN